MSGHVVLGTALSDLLDCFKLSELAIDDLLHCNDRYILSSRNAKGVYFKAGPSTMPGLDSDYRWGFESTKAGSLSLA